MERNKVYFLSDIHLGSLYHEQPLEVERKLVRFLISVKDSANSIYFLGDIFDYWFEYKNVVPQGFIRFLGTISLMSDDGVSIHFFTGNHDVWFSNYIKNEVGAIIHHNSEIIDIMGKRFRLAHGDEETSKEKKVERFLYKLFRNKICRKLYAAVHPRWTVGLAMKCSYKSRKKGISKTIGKIPHAYHNDYFDIEKHTLVQFAKNMTKERPDIDFYIFGHIHLMIDLALRNNSRVVILGDWIKYFSYAVFDGENIYLDQFID